MTTLLVLGILLTGFSTTLAASPTLTPPKRCCLDREFTAHSEVVGVNPFASETAISADHTTTFSTSKQLLADVFVYRNADNSLHRKHTIQDYKQRWQYVIDEDHKNCSVFPMSAEETMPSLCLPESFTYVGATVIGQKPSAKTIDVWAEEDNEDSQYTFSDEMHFTRGCLPVYNRFKMFENGELVEDNSRTVERYAPSLLHANHLDIPAYCPDAPPTASPVGKRRRRSEPWRI